MLFERKVSLIMLKKAFEKNIFAAVALVTLLLIKTFPLLEDTLIPSPFAPVALIVLEVKLLSLALLSIIPSAFAPEVVTMLLVKRFVMPLEERNMP